MLAIFSQWRLLFIYLFLVLPESSLPWLEMCARHTIKSIWTRPILSAPWFLLLLLVRCSALLFMVSTSFRLSAWKVEWQKTKPGTTSEKNLKMLWLEMWALELYGLVWILAPPLRYYVIVSKRQPLWALVSSVDWRWAKYLPHGVITKNRLYNSGKALAQWTHDMAWLNTCELLLWIGSWR